MKPQQNGVECRICSMRSKRAFDTLIVEGGSLRCAFTAGVLDTFAVVGYNRFKRYFAVSAGTMALTSFLAGQRKHFIDVASHMVEDGQFIRFSSAFSEEGLMNLAHLFDHVRRHRPLDIQAAAMATHGKDVRMVTTDHATGNPMYLRPTQKDWLRIMWASSTLPMVTRGKIRVHEKWMFDGGISDALPLQAALDAGWGAPRTSDDFAAAGRRDADRSAALIHHLWRLPAWIIFMATAGWWPRIIAPAAARRVKQVAFRTTFSIPVNMMAVSMTWVVMSLGLGVVMGSPWAVPLSLLLLRGAQHVAMPLEDALIDHRIERRVSSMTPPRFVERWCRPLLEEAHQAR